mmetsp:Transcript_81480/g.143895  ORF Transcript_81480/g.143895 Transcript_81480/m.143895 type:complete len:1076 (+) Transcript_81480:54-3281(+)
MGTCVPWLQWLAVLGVTLSGGQKVGAGKYVAKYDEERLMYALNQEDRPAFLLEVFKPSCPACQAFAPRYAKAAELLKQSGTNIKVVAINGEEARTLMNKFNVDAFPSIFFIPQDAMKTKQLAYKQLAYKSASTAEAIAEWAERMAAPAVTNVSSLEDLPQPSGIPNLVLLSPSMVPAFQSTAEDERLKYRSFWVHSPEYEFSKTLVQHVDEAHVEFVWEDHEADMLDDEGERFEAFLKQNELPELMLVHDPRKLGDEMPDQTAIWILVNGSEVPEDTCGGSDEEATCSAEGPKKNSQKALSKATAPFRDVVSQAVRKFKSAGKGARAQVFAIDIAQWPRWVETNLYGWTAPAIVAMKYTHGPRYFFSDEGAMPEAPDDLEKWLSSLMRQPVRSKSERPVEVGQHEHSWKKLVSFKLEDELRKTPATLLYSFKSPDDYATDEDVVRHQDELEALDDLAQLLQKSCKNPPLVAALDVRKNEVPLSLYAAGNIGTLSAPSLYMVHSDANKKTFGASWGGEIREFQTEPDANEADFSLDKLDKRSKQMKLSKDFRKLVDWVMTEARRVNGLEVPGSIDFEALGYKEQRDPVHAVATEKEVLELMKDYKSGFVEFFSTTCGACKKFAPVYASAARSQLRQVREGEVTEPAAFVSVDCEGKGAAFCSKMKIDAYPTLMFFNAGKNEPYLGGRKKKDLLRYLQTEAEPIQLEISDEEEAVKFVNKRSQPAMLWYGATDTESEPRFQGIAEAAAEWRHTVRLLVFTKDSQNASASNSTVLKIFWPSKRSPDVYAADEAEPFSKDTLEMWISEMTVVSEPLPAKQTGAVAVVVGRSFREAIFGPLDNNFHVMLEVYAPWCGHCQKLAPIYTEFAEKMKEQGRMLVVAKMNADANKIPFEGFDYTGFPTIFYLSPDSDKIKTVQARTLEGLMDFAKNKKIPRVGSKDAPAKDNSLEGLLANFKSEELPDEQTSPVLTVVLKNFLDVVFQDSKHCILMVYAKWCGHCKKMQPELDKFAEEMKPRKDIIVARMNGEANDMPVKGFDVKGYPTIVFVEKGSKEPRQTFTGNLALEQLKGFLKQTKMLS